MSLVEQFVKAAGGGILATLTPAQEMKRQCVEKIADALKSWGNLEPTVRERFMIAALSDTLFSNPELYVALKTGTVKLMKASPPGWSGTVEAMKDHPEIDNPWALAWSMYDEGDTSHYKGLVEKFLDHAKCY